MEHIEPKSSWESELFFIPIMSIGILPRTRDKLTNKFSVLWSGDQIAWVGGPVHGVDLCQVTAQGPPRSHLYTTKWIHIDAYL